MSKAQIVPLLLVSSLLVYPASADVGQRHGWLGVAMSLAPDAGGVRIEHVVRRSPAEGAGLRASDRITRVDGRPVASSREVVDAISQHPPGDHAKLTVKRADRSLELTAVLGSLPTRDELLRLDHVDDPAPAWEGLSPGSDFPTSLASLHGRVVVVDFWATWCGPCREVAPVLSRWQARFGPQGLSVVGITTDPVEAAQAYRDTLNLRYPMATDTHGGTSAAYGVSALPTLFVIDKRGVVRDVTVGVDGDEVARTERLIASLLAEPAP